MKPKFNASPEELQIQNQRMKDTISSLLASNGFKSTLFPDIGVGFNVVVNGVEISIFILTQTL